MPQQQYRLIVRDRIYTPRLLTDGTLERLNCIYTSPVFLWDGSHDALNDVIDAYLERFWPFADWRAIVFPV